MPLLCEVLGVPLLDWCFSSEWTCRPLDVLEICRSPSLECPVFCADDSYTYFHVPRMSGFFCFFCFCLWKVILVYLVSDFGEIFNFFNSAFEI